MKSVIFRRTPSSAEDFDLFDIVDGAPPALPAGHLLLRVLHVSIDPYMLRMLHGAAPYAGLLQAGQPMVGRVIGEAIQSDDPGIPPGSFVLASAPWREITTAPTADCILIKPRGLPLSAYLGAVGQSGVTAWAGMMEVARAESGETVVVSSAAGAVGGVAGQLAKAQGCFVIGIAGGPEKCAYVVQELGFDACIDYRAGDLTAAIALVAPSGVDVHFESVGQEVLDAVLPTLNRHARIALCGLVSQYGREGGATLRNFDMLLTRAIRLEGFGVSDYDGQRSRIIAELESHALAGRILVRETVTRGLENAPKALAGLFSGRNIGKQIVTP